MQVTKRNKVEMKMKTYITEQNKERSREERNSWLVLVVEEYFNFKTVLCKFLSSSLVNLVLQVKLS